MDWIINLFTNTESVAHIALLYAIVIAVGVYLGKSTKVTPSEMPPILIFPRYLGRTRGLHGS